MRSVSLVNIKSLCVNFNASQYKQFLSNKDEYKNMWSSQGLEFWLKFVVSLKYYISNSSSGYDEKCEREIINFLKALTSSSFKEVEDYINLAFKSVSLSKDIESELLQKMGYYTCHLSLEDKEKYFHFRGLQIRLKCAGTFFNQMSAWRTAPAGDNFQFSPPESWFIPVSHSEPLESYIRSKWRGYRSTDRLLGCKTEEVTWWDAPARKVDQSQLKPLVTQDQKSEVQCSKTVPQTLSSSTNVNSKEENVKHSWLPKNSETPLPVTLNEKTFLKFNKDADSRPLIDYHIVQDFPFLPYLKSKFHRMNVKALKEEETNLNYLCTLAWYSMTCDTFGIEYFIYMAEIGAILVNSIQLKNHDIESMYKEVSLWKLLREHDIILLNRLKDVSNKGPSERNCVQHSAEFLLEPCVILQLPWKVPVFYQWLGMAFIEILRLEIETVELRHWPIPLVLNQIVCDLLSLVKDAKERILVGWTILSFNVTLYRQDCSKLNGAILDQVVLPILHTLQFICSGRAFEVLRDVKNLAWQCKQDAKGMMKAGVDTFHIHNGFASFYLMYSGHYTVWDDDSTEFHFPTFLLFKSDRGLCALLEEMKRQKEILPHKATPFSTQPLSNEEIKLYNIVHRKTENKEDGYDFATRMRKTEQVLKEIIFKYDHFSKESCQKVTKLLETLEGRACGYKIFKCDKSSLKPLESLILSCCLYFEVCMYVERLKTNTTVIGTLNLLSARSMQREQLMRAMAACSLLTGQCPRLCTPNNKCPIECPASPEVPINPPQLSAIITEVHDKNMKQSTQQFWSEFPEEWQKPVDFNPKPLTLQDGIPTIVSHLETRVGRIVWNSAQDNFKIDTTKKDVYPHASLVQYVLPCYINFLVDAPQSPQSPRTNEHLSNLIKFVVGIVEYYENTYKLWLASNEKQIKVHYESKESDYLNDFHKQNRFLCRYYLERISFVLHGFAGLGPLDKVSTMPHYSLLGTFLNKFKTITDDDISIDRIDQLFIERIKLGTGINIIYPHFLALYNVCFNILPVPTPDTILYCHELQDLYTADALIGHLEMYYQMSDWYLDQIKLETGADEYFQEITTSLNFYRNELYAIIFETENKFEYPKSMIQTFINGKVKELILKLFKYFKTARRKGAKSGLDVKLLPLWNSAIVRKNFELFIKGKLNSLPLFEKKVVVESSKILQGMLAECNNCHRKETNVLTFIQCPACKQQKYPFPNFYCSTRCQESWWKQEHMAEHLEFELGLCDFANLKVT